MNKERTVWIDNYKGLLILLVVVGHFISPYIQVNAIVRQVFFLIYSFHMPAFVLISGMLSKPIKSEVDIIKEIKKLVIPYVIFQIIMFVVWKLIIVNDEYTFKLFNPYYGLWFLIALFAYRLSIGILSKVKGIVLISLILGLLVGYDVSAGGILSVSRIVVFFPFFVFGYLHKQIILDFVETQTVGLYKLLAVGGVIASGFVIWRMKDILTTQFTDCYGPYIECVENPQLGWFYRLLIYMVASLMIGSLFVLIPKRKSILALLGRNSMSIYLLHLPVVLLMNKSDLKLTQYFMNNKGVLFMVVLSIGLCFLFSSKPFSSIINMMCRIPFEKVMRTPGE